MNLSKLALCAGGVGLLSFVFSTVAVAQPPVTLGVGEAVVGEDGAVSVSGTAEGLPDGAMLKTLVGFKGKPGTQAFSRVTGGAFTIPVGVGNKRVLPGTYAVEVSFDPRVQRRGVEGLKGIEVTPISSEFRVGTEEEEQVELKAARAAYESHMLALQKLNAHMDSKGNDMVIKAQAEKDKALVEDWKNLDELVLERLGHIRNDMKAYREPLFSTYFPDVDGILGEISVSLQRKSAGIGRAVFEAVGGQMPPKLRGMRFSVGNINNNLPKLAGRAYEVLKITGTWAAEAKQEEDELPIQKGHTFISKADKFEITRPDKNWAFDSRSTNSARRLRIRSITPGIGKRLISGVEIRDFPDAESLEDLEKRDKAAAQAQWPGNFKISKSRRFKVKDKSLPGGKRLGQEVRFSFTAGGDKFQAIQYSLFSSDNKRTYTVLSLAEAEIYKDWEKSFKKFNKSFKVTE